MYVMYIRWVILHKSLRGELFPSHFQLKYCTAHNGNPTKVWQCGVLISMRYIGLANNALRTRTKTSKIICFCFEGRWPNAIG